MTKLGNLAACAALGLFASTGSQAGALEGPQTLVHDGLERRYVVRLPDDMRADSKLPLVLVLHGGGGNAANVERMTGFTAKARSEHFIVAYPEGSGFLAGRLLTWNAGHCCGFAMKTDVDDVGFIRALIDDLVARYPVDARRIYATGMSNGGMMTHRLGIELADRLAAIAPVVATVFGDEAAPAQPVPALMINGLKDENVPYHGGSPGGPGARAWDGTPALPAEAQFEFWMRANGCTLATRRIDEGRWLKWSDRCLSRDDTRLYVLKDNGHAWPGGAPGRARGDQPGTALNATDLIWEFFAEHPK